MLDNMGLTLFSPTVHIYFYRIEKAGFIVLFTQEINLHSSCWIALKNK